MKRNKKDQPKSTRIRTNMDEREKDQPKRYLICRLVGHKKICAPNVPKVQVKQINSFYY